MGNLFTELLTIDLPIVQAAMGGVTSPALAAAVSNAGGLGMLALGWSTPDAVRNEIRATKALTRRPFGVNLVSELNRRRSGSRSRLPRGSK